MNGAAVFPPVAADPAHPYIGQAWFNTTSQQAKVNTAAGVVVLATSTLAAFTPGSVIFADASGNLGQDNPLFFWDDTNHRLGIGTASPADTLDVAGNILPHTDLADVLGTTTKRWKQMNVKALEIFKATALTAGTVGSLIIPTNAGPFSDALGGNVDGAIGLDTTNNQLNFRSTTWQAVQVLRPLFAENVAGFGIGGSPIFIPPLGATSSTVEADVQMQVKGTGTVKFLRAYVKGNTSANTTTITLNKNGSPTALTVSIGPGATGAFADNSDTVAVADTDLIDWAIPANASGIVTLINVAAYF
jgi:hypothetical protein